ncbi:MAG: hypothetical protein MUC71_04660 [Steroidobacteraceae bacterium]|nr:hypothetical protein [Steroidobacteraceae bacterium]
MNRNPKARERRNEAVTADLTAVVVAVTGGEPRVLTLDGTAGELERLPSGPFELRHRTLEQGLRSWVESQTRQTLGYVEQLYTFGDRDRHVPTAATGAARVLSIGYVALVREPRQSAAEGVAWRDWYRYFPWEDWRHGRPPVLDAIEGWLRAWVEGASGATERRQRAERVAVNFAIDGGTWNEDRVLERYELAYGAGLVAEAYADGAVVGQGPPRGVGGEPMAGDHRRILATAIARLRGKIKYRPVVFELLPPTFTLLQLQQTVEALAGLGLHKPNFRRLVEQQGLVEDTGAMTLGTGGRPARLVRFRREALLERPAPGLRVRATRAAGPRGS